MPLVKEDLKGCEEVSCIPLVLVDGQATSSDILRLMILLDHYTEIMIIGMEVPPDESVSFDILSSHPSLQSCNAVRDQSSTVALNCC